MAKEIMLPNFRYHPDPVATGAIEASDGVCECCGQRRGYRYTSTPYAEQELEEVCPWCIADGSLAAKFDSHLVDDTPLLQAGLPAAIVEEVTRRTPGYAGWQQEIWLSCCGDACEYHGDAPAAELWALDADGLACLAADSGFSVDDLAEILPGYSPRGNPAFYKFVCRHCGRVRYHGDCT